MLIPVSQPYLNKEILSYAHEAIDSGWLSSHGKFVDKATELLKEKTGQEYVLLVNNGTSATHLVSRVLQEFVGRNSVVAPNNVYVAAWNSFLFDRYYFIKPVEPNLLTWNMDEDELLKTVKPGDNVLAVHNLGSRINISKLKEKLPSTIFVEDNCEGFSLDYALSPDALCSSVSFYGNKIITTGEGGAFFCHSADVLEYARRVAQQGQTSTQFIHDVLASNYRMTNIQAAILYGQLVYSDEILERRQGVFDIYTKLFSNTGIKIQKYDSHSYWMFGIRIPDLYSTQPIRDRLLNEFGIETRPMFYPMSKHQHLRVYAKEDHEHIAEMLHNQCILLPTFPELCETEQEYIKESVMKCIPQ